MFTACAARDLLLPGAAFRRRVPCTSRRSSSSRTSACARGRGRWQWRYGSSPGFDVAGSTRIPQSRSRRATAPDRRPGAGRSARPAGRQAARGTADLGRSSRGRQPRYPRSAIRRFVSDAQVPVERIARFREHCGILSRGAVRDRDQARQQVHDRRHGDHQESPVEAILRAIKLAKAMNPKNSPVSARRRASLLRPSASIASIRLAFASASAPRSIKVSM